MSSLDLHPSLLAQLSQGSLQTGQAADALVVDKNLWHLTNGGAALFIKSHALGFIVNFDFLIRQGACFEEHFGGLTLWARRLGVDNDFERHIAASWVSTKVFNLASTMGFMDISQRE